MIIYPIKVIRAVVHATSDVEVFLVDANHHLVALVVLTLAVDVAVVVIDRSETDILHAGTLVASRRARLRGLFHSSSWVCLCADRVHGSRPRSLFWRIART